MKIRTRIFMVVVIMGVMICGVGGIAVYFANNFSDKVQQLEEASARAFAGEHLNRLVTAVVMDARGIYASETVEQATPFAQGIMASLDKIDAHLQQWRTIIEPDEVQAFDGMLARTAEFRTFRAETARLGQIDPAQADEQGNNDANRANRKAYQAEIDAVIAHDQERFDVIKVELDSLQSTLVPVVAGTTLLGLLLGVAAAAYVVTRYVAQPLAKVTRVMGSLAEGDLAVEVPYAGEKNEIGEMAAATPSSSPSRV
ncbi:MAG: HAMP domain-containing protein, partial [Hyphomicrobiales bacterium]